MIMTSGFLAPKPHCKQVNAVTLYVGLSSMNMLWTIVMFIKIEHIHIVPYLNTSSFQLSYNKITAKQQFLMIDIIIVSIIFVELSITYRVGYTYAVDVFKLGPVWIYSIVFLQ